MDYGATELIVSATASPGVYQSEQRAGDDRAYLEELYGGTVNTKSGVSINQRSAFTYSPVWQAINLISGDVAKLPLNVMRRSTDRQSREIAYNHAAQQLVRWQPNQFQSAFEFWRMMMTHVLLWNRAFALIDFAGNGRPKAIYPLLPDRTTYECFPGDDFGHDRAPWYVSEVGGVMMQIPARYVLHFEGISITRCQPLELLQLARDSFALGLAAEDFSSRFFSNGAQTGGILEVPAAFSKKATDKLEEGFRKKYTGLTNAFRTVILREGAKFHSTQVDPRQAQLTELRQEQIRDVARWFNLPPHKLGDQTRVSYNSLEQENQSYLDSTLSHWLKTIAYQCWMKLLTQQQKRNHEFAHDTTDLIQADVQTRASVATNLIQWGVVSQNEAREWLNMNPREGGDAYLQPLNMSSDAEAEPEETEDQADEASEIRILLADALETAIEHVRKSILRSASKREDHEQFQAWLAENADELRSRVCGRIEKHVAAIARLESRDGDALLAELLDGSVGALTAACQQSRCLEGIAAECWAAVEAAPQMLTIMGGKRCD